VEVYLTPGDLARIARHTRRGGFSRVAAARSIYLEASADPVWRTHVLGVSGRRRILRRRRDGECVFLAADGCVLPLEVRPLLCRIFPYDFDHRGLTRPDPTCPVARDPDPEATLASMGMGRETVRRWHRQLYDEILTEAKGKADDPASTAISPPGEEAGG
jgi:hypothetical protein